MGTTTHIQVKNVVLADFFFTFITLLNSSIPYILPVSTALSAWQVDGSQWSTAASVQGPACQSSP